MNHVFVETNWVVDWAGPAHLRQRAAAMELAARAGRGEVALHLPGICISEAKAPTRRNLAKNDVASVGELLLWAVKEGYVAEDDAAVVRRVHGELKSRLQNDLSQVDARLTSLRSAPGIDVFALDAEMLEVGLELVDSKLELQPFDLTILAAVLVASRRLIAAGSPTVAFCTTDHHLQPWDKGGRSKPLLADLYDRHKVWVYGDFTMTTPEPYEGWPPAFDPATDGDR